MNNEVLEIFKSNGFETTDIERISSSNPRIVPSCVKILVTFKHGGHMGGFWVTIPCGDNPLDYMTAFENLRRSMIDERLGL